MKYFYAITSILVVAVLLFNGISEVTGSYNLAAGVAFFAAYFLFLKLKETNIL